MSTTQMLSWTHPARLGGQSNDFAVGRLRLEADRARPETSNCVERLKLACAAEARAKRELAARTVAAFAK